MLQLYQYSPRWEVPSASPFCLKLQAYLHLAQIPYESVILDNPHKAPKGKLPYIRDDETVIADSSLIIDYLKSKYGDILDHHLSPKEQGHCLAIQRLVEDHLYWVIVYSRWLDNDYWPTVKQHYFAQLPFVLRHGIAYFARKKIQRDLYAQGLGRHQAEDIYQLGKTDIVALSDILDQQDFFMGNTPCSVDASCYAMLANIISVPIDSPLKQQALQQSNLINYIERVKKRFF